jgi:hypothetical protein
VVVKIVEGVEALMGLRELGDPASTVHRFIPSTKADT